MVLDIFAKANKDERIVLETIKLTFVASDYFA
jgi:hypothetical protein